MKSQTLFSLIALAVFGAASARADVVKHLDGNLCRCCGYTRILEAVELAARKLAPRELPR